MKILAVFPDLHDANPGGVQVSGRLAWEMLQQHADARALIANRRLDVLETVKAARFDADIILFWHLDLLRLMPFMRWRATRVAFLHGIEAWRKQSWLARRFLKDVHFIANSRYTVQRALPFIPQLGQANTQIVHLGVGSPSATIEPPMQRPRAAVMIGRLDADERYKGHHEVIRIWSQVIRAVSDAQLWIIGEGSLREELEFLVTNLALQDHIRFYGRVTEEEKQSLLVAARCLVLPSRAEGFGLVYLEAMRVGRPSLVGLDAGREVVNPPEAGLSADPDDADALANAIVTLLSDDTQWTRQSEASRARYEAQFTASHFQHRLQDALKRLH